MKELIYVKVGDLLEKINEKKIKIFVREGVVKTNLPKAKEGIEEIKNTVLWLSELKIVLEKLEKMGIKVEIKKELYSYPFERVEININDKEIDIKIVTVHNRSNMENLNDVLEYEKEVLKLQRDYINKLKGNKILIKKEFKELLGL